MRVLDRSSFLNILGDAQIKHSLVNALRYLPEKIDDWEDLELLPIFTRNDNYGVLLIDIVGTLNALPFNIRRRIVNNATGRSKPVICDLCFTYRAGISSAVITFSDRQETKSLSILCCADLLCSRHVRNKTSASRMSRTQLPESISTEARVGRLKRKLA